MDLAFDDWVLMSDLFMSVSGAPIAALPWGDHFALFATDSDGHVCCAGGDPQFGAMDAWAPISDGFAGTPGVPVTVLPWGDHFALFAIDASGAVCCASGDPETGLMSPWVPISDGFSGNPYGAVAVQPWGDHFAFFATDDTGLVCCAGGDPQNGLMGPWVPISDGLSAQAGGSVTAVPWNDGFALFVVDATRRVWCAGGDPQYGLMGPWAPISDSFSGIAGSPVAAVPWNGSFAFFATDASGVVQCAAGDPQNGLMGPWAPALGGTNAPPGAAVGAVGWNDGFAICVADNTAASRVASGDPQVGFTEWATTQDLLGSPNSHVFLRPGFPIAIVSTGEGVDLFAVSQGGGAFGTGGGARMMTSFTPGVHGWHFDNDFVNPVLGGLFDTNGLCGGMAYSALDYYFNGIPIPTHRAGDFETPSQTYPSSGRLHAMIYNRLIDSFTDNFGKWSCVYPALDAVAPALGLLFYDGLGAGIIGLLGAIDGYTYGELHKHFECPDGGPHGMTRAELPHLIKDFLDSGMPVPLGLIWDTDIAQIGNSHQVVAYGYSVVGGKTVVYVYDDNYHDRECILIIDTKSPGTIVETFADRSALPKGDTYKWSGLLVEDGYQIQPPSYGWDLGVDAPQSVSMTGRIVMGPIVPESPLNAQVGDPPPAGNQGGRQPILLSQQQVQRLGHHLGDTFSIRNYGEYQAHFSMVGIIIDAPDATTSDVPSSIPASDNILAANDRQDVSIDIGSFGTVPGTYVLRAGYQSVPLENNGAEWLGLFYPGVVVPVGRW